jgi:uncharacterized protein
MNKPAAKEPSMDEILSSIRQIIADDDATGGAGDAQAEESADEEVSAGEEESGEDMSSIEDISFDMPEGLDDAEVDEALELSSAQIVEDEGAEPDGAEIANIAEEFEVPELVVPDDVAFDEEAEAEPEPEPVTAASAAPMPDPDLSADLAEQILQPATEAAVRSAFSKLGTLTVGANGLTIEAMLREMLRPMLKEWLDENLPATVERLVEKEIERLARGR